MSISGYTVGMSQSTVFKSNKSQAIRLPKAVALPDHVKKVKIIKQGSARLIIPVGSSWEEFFATPGIGDDFDRPPQPPLQERKFED
jgi:antitoxin VapB